MIAELDMHHVKLVLTTQFVGRIACVAEGRPYIVPVTYVYEDGFIYGHTNDGLKVRMMRQNPLVCFQVDDIQDMVRWRSVVAWGRFEELHGADALKALELLVSRLKPIVTSETSFPIDGEPIVEIERRIRLGSSKSVFYRIGLTEMTGRYERK